MSPFTRRRVLISVGSLLVSRPLRTSAGPIEPRAAQRAAIDVSGDVALASLLTLADGYLSKFADCFTLFASTAAARSADWDLIQAPLGALAERNVAALVWFALPDGSYWSVQQGKSTGTLSDREYFPRVLAGEAVIGSLVVSKATGRSVAIVAVPIRSDGGAVVGVLGASVYLEQLSGRLKDEMALSAETIFYSFDATPLLGLEWDASLIFVDPLSLGPEIRAVFEDMLARDQGIVRYRFRNQWRTVIFRRSPLTRWWYALGTVQGNPAAAR